MLLLELPIIFLRLFGWLFAILSGTVFVISPGAETLTAASSQLNGKHLHVVWVRHAYKLLHNQHITYK